jgi:hypothetical protein
MKSKQAALAWARLVKWCRSSSSVSTMAKRLSVTALSRQCATLQVDGRLPADLHPVAERQGRVLTALAAVMDHPGRGPAFQIAISSASSTGSLRLWSAIAQSTIGRENTSSTTAGHYQPSPVATYVMSAVQI